LEDGNIRKYRFTREMASIFQVLELYKSRWRIVLTVDSLKMKKCVLTCSVFDVWRASWHRVWTTCFRWNRTHGSTLSSLHAALVWRWNLCKFRTPHRPESCFVVYVAPAPLREIMLFVGKPKRRSKMISKFYIPRGFDLNRVRMPSFVNVFLPLIHNFMNLFFTLLCLRSHPPPVLRFHGPQECPNNLTLFFGGMFHGNCSTREQWVSSLPNSLPNAYLTCVTHPPSIITYLKSLLFRHSGTTTI